MSAETILASQWVLKDNKVISDLAVLVRDERIEAVDKLQALRSLSPKASEMLLPDCLVMAGFINAHQHGNGLGEVRFGYPDNFLEVWINNRAGRRPLDAYASTLIAAAHMLENGVTCIIHANTTFGGEDYETELRASLRAYDESGLRASVAIGAADQLALVYPYTEESRFLKRLPSEFATEYTSKRRFSYAGDAADTIGLMDRLLVDFKGHPRIQFCYGPAGPQWVSDGLFRSLVKDAERRDLGLHMHCLESPAQAAVCKRLYPEGTLRHLAKLGALTSKTVLAHGVFLAEDDILVAAKSDVTIVRNPGSNLRLRCGIAPLAHYLQEGVRVAIGTDNGAIAQDEDILKELRLAASLARSPHWSGPEPPLTKDLLDILTLNGATAAQFAQDVGQLKVGMRADLVAVNLKRAFWPGPQPDKDPIEALLNRAEGRDVVLTMVNGHILYKDGALTKLDRDRLAELGLALLRNVRNVPEKERQHLTALLQEHMTEFYDNSTAGSILPAKSLTRGLGPS